MLKARAPQKLKALFASVEQCLMEEEMPSRRLDELSLGKDFTQYPFSMLFELRKTEQSPVYHPEGSVWEHTLLVVDEAASRRGMSREPKTLMWAALLHDIGKPAATRRRNGRITAYNHDSLGAELAESFLAEFIEDSEFIKRVIYLVRYHMQPLYLSKRKEFFDLKGIREQGDARELALLCLSDRLGRKGADEEQEKKETDLFLRLIDGKEKV